MSERADRELVMITGATRELGREVCHLFAGEDWDLIMVAEDDLDRTAESLRSCGVHVRALASRLESITAADTLWGQVQDGDKMPDAVVLINRAHGRAAKGSGRADALLGAVEAELAPTIQLVRLAMRRMTARGSGEILIMTEPSDGPATDDAVEQAYASALSSIVQGWQRDLDGTKISLHTHTAPAGAAADAARSSFEAMFPDVEDGTGPLPRFHPLTRASRRRHAAGRAAGRAERTIGDGSRPG